MISHVSIRIKQPNDLRSSVTRSACAETKCHARVVHKLFFLLRVSLTAYMPPENFDIDENVRIDDSAECNSSKTTRLPLILVMSA